jgi:hypothetical protein
MLASREILIEQNIKKRTGPALCVLCGSGHEPGAASTSHSFERFRDFQNVWLICHVHVRVSTAEPHVLIIKLAEMMQNYKNSMEEDDFHS